MEIDQIDGRGLLWPHFLARLQERIAAPLGLPPPLESDNPEEVSRSAALWLRRQLFDNRMEELVQCDQILAAASQFAGVEYDGVNAFFGIGPDVIQSDPFDFHHGFGRGLP